MTYASPELMVIGRAEVLVLGTTLDDINDHPDSLTKPVMGVALGLD